MKKCIVFIHQHEYKTIIVFGIEFFCRVLYIVSWPFSFCYMHTFIHSVITGKDIEVVFFFYICKKNSLIDHCFMLSHHQDYNEMSRSVFNDGCMYYDDDNDYQ